MAIIYNGHRVTRVIRNGVDIETIRIGEEMTSLIEGDDFVRAKWLVGDGSAYIDTNIALKDIADYELQFWSEVLPQSEGVFGARISATDAVNLGVIIGSTVAFDFGNYTQNRKYAAGYTIPFTVNWQNGGNVYVNNASIATEVYYTTTSEMTAKLFWLENFPSANESLIYSGKIAKLAISNQISLTPVRLLHAIPSAFDANGIARNTDECGMYDAVSGLFYGNVGSGSFSVSNE